MLQVLANVSLKKFQLQKEEAWAMQKLFIKEKESIGKKWTSVRDIENNGYSDARLKRKKKKR